MAYVERDRRTDRQRRTLNKRLLAYIEREKESRRERKRERERVGESERERYIQRRDRKGEGLVQNVSLVERMHRQSDKRDRHREE